MGQRQNGPPPSAISSAPMTKEDQPSKKIVPEPVVKNVPTPKAMPVEAKPKPADKSRPVSSTPVHGTPWCVVWTGDQKAFFYNPSTKTSVWERPPDLIGRADVTEMLKSPAAAEKVKAKSIPPGFPSNSNTGTMPDFKSGNSNSKKNKAPIDSDGEEAPVTKKKKVELVFEDEMKANEGSNNTSNGGANNNAKSVKNKDAAMEAEVKAARERQLVPLEQRMSQFREFAHKHGKEDRFKGIEKSRERESLFNDFMTDIKKKDKEERAAKRDAAKKDFVAMLKEFADDPENELDRHSRWSDVKKKLDSDSRYKNVDSSGLREDYFLDFVHDLKDEHKKKKKDKKRSSRSRSRSPKGKDRSRSRSRRRSKSPKKKSKKDKRDRSRDRDDDEYKKDKKKSKKK